MKNVQVVDGGANSVFELYAVVDDVFNLMFPNGNDVAFLEDIERVFLERGDERLWQDVYANRLDKRSVQGIHGTLHLTGSPCDPRFFPTRKEEEVLHHLPREEPGLPAS
ncbi:MAG TPA: hypothetical protein VJ123_10050 [Anaerolineales bacterium]|nr:hypothetical protein [Anaerolineales bacterium]